MYRQIRRSRKASIANSTSVWLFTGMFPHVNIQRRRLGEFFPTKFARKRLFTSMRSYVLFQVRSSRKRTVTNVAIEEILACMSTNVFLSKKIVLEERRLHKSIKSLYWVSLGYVSTG